MSTTKVNEEHVREAAYYIWYNEGQPEGKAEEHWWRALDELLSKYDEETTPKRRVESA
jgi:hypothetical protein